MTQHCPICRDEAMPRKDNAAYPFCSERCRLIDLGNWLGEGYRIPSDDAPDDPRDQAPDDDPS